MCRYFTILLALALVFSFSPAVLAADVDADTVYCFSADDFQPEEALPLQGVCITGLPDPGVGTVFLGKRVVQKGDILTAEQLERLTFSPVFSSADGVAEVTYLPIYENKVAKSTTLIISVWGKTDNAPVAQDFALETYKNLPAEGMLKVLDPEGKQLTYSLLRKPRQGTVEIREDGSFVYTPKKNKVGVDSFTYTAADPAGNVSREATVTVQILKPSDNRRYADTENTSCRFTAEWLRHTGLFTGETINGQLCFQPEKTVSRGEFLAMLVKALEIPVEEDLSVSLPDNTPQWLLPYLAAALRAGLTAGWPEADTFSAPITGAEAAVMLQNALDLTVSQEILESYNGKGGANDAPAWAAISLAVLEENGIYVNALSDLTRSDVSQLLYTASHLQATASGGAVFRMQ